MRSLQDYLHCQYVDGGREWPLFDCWGLVRDVRSQLYQLPELPAFGEVPAADKRGMTASFHQVEDLLQQTEAAPGAIACHFVGRVLAHVGVVVQVDNRLQVLHISSKTGVLLTDIPAFTRQCKTRFYLTC